MESRERREVLRLLPHGLQVVTVADGDEMNGYTSSWMTQGSFDPPLLVLGVRADSSSRELMRRSGVFCVNFLAEDQQDIAQRFFQPVRRAGDKLSGVPYRLGEETGCPILTDLLAYAECRIVNVYEGGDHHVVVGEVLEAKMLREGRALALGDTPWQYGG